MVRSLNLADQKVITEEIEEIFSFLSARQIKGSAECKVDTLSAAVLLGLVQISTEFAVL